MESAVEQVARQAQQHSYSPYSQFKVGAAIESEDDYIFAGTNIENASYGLTICAERVAAFNLAMSRRRKIRKVVVVTDSEVITAPCGACRQVLWEFGDKDTIVIGVNHHTSKQWTLGELLPDAFGPADLLALGGTDDKLSQAV